MKDTSYYQLQDNQMEATLSLLNVWTCLTLGDFWNDLHIQLNDLQVTRVTLDASGIQTIDTSGLWALERITYVLQTRHIHVTTIHKTTSLEQYQQKDSSLAHAAPDVSLKNPLYYVEKIGRIVVEQYGLTLKLIAFLGEVMVAMGALIRNPRTFRYTSFVAHLEQVGVNALPIIGLISFLIGVVLAYQGHEQLRRFGADLYTINLVGISVLREVGILLAAIVMAGRSGSAFTAQIGTMKLNQELDAMYTLGLDPINTLVIPRILALVLVMPFLAFFADIMGLLGGAAMATNALNISFDFYMMQLKGALTEWTFWIGIIKAPVFAFIIALVGCFEGMNVEGDAESVGKQTTRSVVESIFIVIVFDALFSILFSLLKI